MRRVFLIITTLIFINNIISASFNILFWKKKEVKNEKAVKQTEYEKTLDKAQSSFGFINTHIKNGKIYLEIPVKYMGRDMLLGSTITSTSDNGNGITGAKPTNPIYFVLIQNEDRIEMRLPTTYDLIGNKNLVTNNDGAIYKLFKRECYNQDSSSVVINATELFINDDKYLSPIDKRGKNSLWGRKKLDASLDKDKSFIDSSKSFEDNFSVKSTLSYKYTVADRGAKWKDVPFTVDVTRSVLLLDTIYSRPRITDSRVSVFPTDKTVFSAEQQGSKKIYYANIWDLEPIDKEAYKSGKKVDPVNPIIFYIDDKFPDKWKSYISEGVNQWNEMFEEAGFSNAIKAVPFPENDSIFDPDNLKYSCVRYAPLAFQNAMGPSWVDFRNGKIINASVYIYHDVIELLNNWLFTQTSQVDKRVRQTIIPDSIIGDAMRYVVSHEIGHCLGFMHNMSASAQIPVDSLRSAHFTNKYGTTTSIMDYARFNYVAQPEDSLKGLRLIPPRFGEYDQYLVKWSYTWLDEADEYKDYEIRNKWLHEAYKNPLYRFGKQQFYGILDPKSQTEDLGDNAVLASEYGVKNLKYIMSNYHNWLEKDDKDYSYRKSIYSSIVSQYIMYLGHVHSYIGGIYLSEKHSDDAHNSFEPVSKEMQKEAFDYLVSQLDDLNWIDDNVIMNKLSITKPISAKLREYILNLVMNLPQKTELCAAKSEDPFTSKECLDLIYKKIWGKLISGKPLTPEEMYNQQQSLYFLCKGATINYPQVAKVALTNNEDCVIEKLFSDKYEEEAGSIYAYTEPGALYFDSTLQPSDFYSYVTKIERLLKNNLNHSNKETRSYCEYTLFNLQKAIKNEKSK